ncbi:IS3 family transposase, partial [Streptomyces sp. NPDC006283]
MGKKKPRRSFTSEFKAEIDARRVHAVLQREGQECGRRRVAGLMRAAGMQ